MNNVKEFLKHHSACTEGYEWAIKNCQTMQEVWDTVKDEWLIWVAIRAGVLTDRELHEFSLYCAESVKHLMTDERSLNALVVKRKWLDGEATDEELSTARSAADDAARSAYATATTTTDDDAARSAYATATTAAATAAATTTAATATAATTAAYATARSAATTTAAYTATARSAAYTDAQKNQVEYLRKNTTPNFSLEV